MKRVVWGTLLAFLLGLGAATGSRAQEEKKSEPDQKSEQPAEKKPEKQTEKKAEDQPATGRKELKVAGTPYVYTGPDTGFGVGGAIMYRDMGGKVGRDQTFSLSFTQTQYQNYSLDWTEPDFLSKGPRGNIYLTYDNKPARRFYGIGNLTKTEELCNWGWNMYQIRPAYIYPSGVAKFRARLQYNYQFVMPHDGTLDDPSNWRYSRPISKVYPELYHSDQFKGGATAGPGLYLIWDTRKDKFELPGGREEKVFPIRGGYRELFVSYNGPTFGSRFEYNKEQLDVRQYFGFGKNDDTVAVVRVKLISTQGNVPFWDLPNFGSGNDLRGFYDGRFRGKSSSQFNLELRQGIAPNWNYSLFKGAITLKYPFLFAFYEAGRVYDSYTRLGSEWSKDYHPSYGGGFRFVITPTVVIRFEYAFSPEQTAFIVNASQPF